MSAGDLKDFAFLVSAVVVGVGVAGYGMSKFRSDHTLIAEIHSGYDS